VACNGQPFSCGYIISGYGLVCHRALKACAQVMGIKDLYCKVEANTKNYQAIVRAFFDALVHQVTNFAIFGV